MSLLLSYGHAQRQLSAAHEEQTSRGVRAVEGGEPEKVQGANACGSGFMIIIWD